jgi:single-stranded DNA-binding protein
VNDPLALDIPPLEDYTPAPPQPVSRNGTDAAKPAAPAPTPAPQPKRATRGFNMLVWRGRLASDPELREAASGKRYLRVRCLQDQPDRNGQPGTQGIEIVLFNERADQFAAFFRKGDEVLVKGRLTIETKHDQHGVVRTTTSLHPDGSIELLHRPPKRDS